MAIKFVFGNMKERTPLPVPSVGALSVSMHMSKAVTLYCL